MRPDNAAPIIAAAQRRHELTRSKAIQALRELHATGTPVTFEAVARTAGVSRSWLYTQRDIRSEIERLREITRRTPTPPVPTSQHTSDPSLRARLQAALDRNRRLEQENRRLRRQLAQALGERRNPPRPDPADPDPEPGTSRHPSATIEPC
jgi:hypothetical protein